MGSVEVLKKLNEFAPALTLLVVIAGFVWVGGRWSAQFEAVRQDVQELSGTVQSVQADVRTVQADVRALQADVRAVQADVRTVQADVRALQADVRAVEETLPHMVSCMIDLQRFGGSPDSTLPAGDGRRQPPLPASCEHALARTTPAQGE